MKRPTHTARKIGRMANAAEITPSQITGSSSSIARYDVVTRMMA